MPRRATPSAKVTTGPRKGGLRAAPKPQHQPTRGRTKQLARAKPKTAPSSPPPAREMIQIGSRLHHARLAREIRMKDLAALARCSESLISKIENNKAAPSLNTLYRICSALNLTLGELLATPAENGHVVTRAGERRIVEIDSLRKGTGLRMERLVPYAKGHLLQGNIHVIAPGGSSDGTLTHGGEEVGYVISGEIELIIDGRVHVAAAGDSFCYRSELPHGYRNRGKIEARVLFVNTPPTF